MSLCRHVSSLLRVAALSSLLAAGAAQADAYGDMSALIQSGKTSEAVQYAERYLANNARDPQMRFLKGVAQSQGDNTEAALETFTLLTEEYPELPEPYNNLAVIYAANNQLDKARNALETAVRNNPSYAVAHENLGDIYTRLAYNAYQRSQQLHNSRGVQLKLSTLFGLLQPAR